MARKSTYKQMLIESLIDISSMQSYKSPAEKVLDAKDEKYETFRPATSEVDVLGRAYSAWDDVENNFITEANDMDDENVAQGEPDVKIELPDGHDPDITDLEDNIDESDPDKNYQDPITGESDTKDRPLQEDAEEPYEDGEEEDEEDLDDEGTISDPEEGIPDADEYQNADPDIAVEGDDDLGEDLPEDEPFDGEEEPEEGEVCPECGSSPCTCGGEDIGEEDTDSLAEGDEDLGETLPEDAPDNEDLPPEDDEVIVDDTSSEGDEDLPPEDDELVEEDEDLGENLPEDGDEGLGEDLPEDEDLPPEDEDLSPEDDEDDGVTMEDGDSDALGGDLPEDEPVDCVPAEDGSLADPDTDGEYDSRENEVEDFENLQDDQLTEALMEQDVTMDPNASLGAAPAAAPAPAPGAAPAAPMDPNAAAGGMPADPNAPIDPNDPNAPADPNDPNAVAEDPNAQGEEQDPILDVDSNVVASDTTQPTTESVMESLISELGSYSDNASADTDLFTQEYDD